MLQNYWKEKKYLRSFHAFKSLHIETKIQQKTRSVTQKERTSCEKLIVSFMISIKNVSFLESKTESIAETQNMTAKRKPTQL